MKFEFKDYRFDVKAALNDITKGWLHTWSHEIASDAKKNCNLDGDAGVQLRKSYTAEVNEDAGEAQIGSPLEASYWEEFGTGEHAVDTSKSRKGWWVYTPGSPGPEGYQSKVYASEAEAESAAAYIRKTYHKEAVATNGRDPQYTLEKAFKNVSPKAKADLESKLKGGMG